MYNFLQLFGFGVFSRPEGGFFTLSCDNVDGFGGQISPGFGGQ
jgi:hypothetical protein